SDTIAESLFQEIALDEYDERPEDQVMDADDANCPAFLLCGQCCVEAELPEMVTNPSLSKMVHRVGEPPDLALNDQVFVHRHVVVPGAALSDQPDLIIGIHSGMADPGAVEIILARNLIGNGISPLPCRNPRQDFGL